MFRATLFDFNGVLVDDEHVHFEAFAEALAPLDITLSERAYWDKYLGYDDRGAFEAILTDHGRAADSTAVERLIEAKKPCYLRRAQAGLRLFDGAAELVRQQAATGIVGVVSGALRHEIEFGLAQLGVREQVAFLVAAEDTRAGKPDPEGYLKGLSRLEQLGHPSAATEVLVIEDSYSGVEAAKLAGLCCVAVTHSYPEHTLRAAGADRVVETLVALTPKLLSELFEARSR